MNKEFVNLTANQRLMELLASINHQIAYKIVECVKYRWNAPISFLDFGDTNDTVSFVNSSKVWELMDKYGDDYKIQAWISNRSCIKIGKAVKVIFGDEFPINHPKGAPEIKPKVDIESFVNMFKSERDKNKNYERFELVKGSDIKYWYNQKNYSRFIQEDTTLAKSCLRYEEYGKFLQMYVDNPQLVNMLILKDDAERLRARALVWYLTYPEGRIYMERIYTINDADVELYKKYAREQGWLYKSRQTYGYHHNIVDGKNGEEYNWENFIMKVQLKHKPVKYHPYLDTLCVYNPETGIISNEGKLLRRAPYLKLADSQGGFIDEADHREQVFSKHYNDEIAREEAEFVNLDQDWVFQQDVVYVHNSGGKKSHRCSKLVCQSKIFGNTKYFLADDCVWSEHLNTFIYKQSSREAYLDDSKTKKVIIHRRMIGKFFEINKDGDIIKKKVDASMPFEDFLEKRGLSMSSKRKTVEKVYEEWNYNRTINWGEPDGDTDTEEITPHSRIHDWIDLTGGDDFQYDRPTRRRRRSAEGEDEFIMEEPDVHLRDEGDNGLRPVDPNTANQLFGTLNHSGIFGLPTPTQAPTEEQMLIRSRRPQVRVVRPDEPTDPRGDEGAPGVSRIFDTHHVDNRIRFTISQDRPARLIRVDTPHIEPDVEPDDEPDISEPNTSAQQNPNDTASHPHPVDRGRPWAAQPNQAYRGNYHTWIDNWVSPTENNEDNNGQERENQ